MATDHCEICGLADQKSDNAGSPNRVRVTCARCGTFEWEPPATVPKPATEAGKIKLSAFVREQNGAGIVPFLAPLVLQQVERRPIPRLRDRALRALAAMVDEIGYDPNSTFSFSQSLRVHAVAYCRDQEQLHVLLQILAGDGLVQVDGMMGDAVRLTPAGLLQAEELSQPGGAYLQGFVAMSFDSSMNDAYTAGFDPGIRGTCYQPIRIDGKEHINGISDEILAEIRRSRFLVADYTLLNNGVYFEAGVAVGLGIPVIATCRADHLDKLHFDIKHINTLKWETPAQLARDLAKRISAVIGDGPLPLYVTLTLFWKTALRFDRDSHNPPRTIFRHHNIW
jgi:hypothetical protein